MRLWATDGVVNSVATKARGCRCQPMQVCQDALLLFPGNDMNSSRRGHTTILTNKHIWTTTFINNDYSIIVNDCFDAFCYLFEHIGNVNGRIWCQCVCRFNYVRPKLPIYLGRHPIGKILNLNLGTGRIMEPSVAFLWRTLWSVIYIQREQNSTYLVKQSIFTGELVSSAK